MKTNFWNTAGLVYVKTCPHCRQELKRFDLTHKELIAIVLGLLMLLIVVVVIT